MSEFRSAPGFRLPSAAEALSADVVDELNAGEAAQSPGPDDTPRQRRVWLPAMLLLATCLSTFWVGSNQWFPLIQLWWGSDGAPETMLLSRQMVLTHWQDGIVYMVCVLGILLAHEMGHFLATIKYRIPASLPFVLPMPLMPIGTFGAVIAMDGRKADRKQTFDIGIAGPLAGLVLAVPIMIWGVMQLNFTEPAYGPFALRNPLFIQFLLAWVQPAGYEPGMPVAMSQLNPYFMAGWVGLLVTGLNMLPVSQLDGGHVIYTLFGKPAHWIARAFMVTAIGYLAYSLYFNQEAQWILMIGLILLVGIDHPPTRDDTVPIGYVRYALGLASLAIPILCFSPRALSSLVM